MSLASSVRQYQENSPTALNFAFDELRDLLTQSSIKFEELSRQFESLQNTSKSLIEAEEQQNAGHTNQFEEEEFHDDMLHEEFEGPVTAGEVKSRRPQSISAQRRLELLKSPPDTLKKTLENFTVQELALNNWLRKRPVLISDNQMVERALSRINAHEVHALPVVNQNKDVIGLLDIVDIATAIAKTLKEKPFDMKSRSDLMIKRTGDLFVQVRSKTYVISNKASLWSAAEQLVNTKQERFIIVDRNNFIVEPHTQPETHVDGILTCCDVLRFLTQNILLMRREPTFSKKLRELGLPARPPRTCSLDDDVGKVFLDMSEKNCTGVAVLGENGKLHANLSTSDLRTLTRKTISLLNGTVKNFLLHDRKRGWWARPIVVTPDETFISCILQFVSTKTHRVYVVDNQFRPVGEIDVMDIIKELIKLKV